MNVEQIVLFVHLFVLYVLDGYSIVRGKRRGLLVFWDMSMHLLLVEEKLKCGAACLHFSAKEKGYALFGYCRIW